MGKRVDEPTPEQALFDRALKKAKSAAHDLGLDPSTNKDEDELVYQITQRAVQPYIREIGRVQAHYAQILSEEFQRNSCTLERYNDLRIGVEKLANEFTLMSITARREVVDALDALVELDEQQRLKDEEDAKRKDKH